MTTKASQTSQVSNGQSAVAAARTAQVRRTTRETDITLDLNLDGAGRADISTGVGFYDHLLTSLVTHSRLDVSLVCKGDLHVDDHHTVEDAAIALGTAISQALGERKAITRFGSAYAPMDESLARAAIDLVTRPFSIVNLALTREKLGTLSCENIPHVLASLATAGRFTMHVDVLRGDNDHHKAEAAFKAVALALRKAVLRDVSGDGVASTKGVM